MITSTKSEIRNPKQIQRHQIQMTETLSPLGRSVLDSGFWSFVLVSDFEFRISNFVLGILMLLCLSSSCHQDRARDLHLDRIDAVVQEEIRAGNFPGAVVLVGKGKKVLYHKAFGLAIAEPTQEPMQKDTVFDLASMTKPLATAASIMVLVDRGKLDPNDYVREYLPAFACGGKEEARLKHLLTHTSACLRIPTPTL